MSLEKIALIDEKLARRRVGVVSGEWKEAVATHLEPRASTAPSHGPFDALDERASTVHLGQVLAMFLGVPFIDQSS